MPPNASVEHPELDQHWKYDHAEEQDAIEHDLSHVLHWQHAILRRRITLGTFQLFSTHPLDRSV
jgi:hypothetical protein